MQTINASNFLKHEVDINPSFDAENSRMAKKSRINSLLTTLGIHAAVFLVLFYFFTLTPPDPPLSNQGVFLNIGFDQEGMGDVQPMGSAEELSAPVPDAASAPMQQEKVNDVVTQETEEDVPAIQNKVAAKKTNPVTTPPNTTKNSSTASATPPKPQPKALYPGSTANSSTGEGTSS